MKKLFIKPIGKPRMTQRDKWLKPPRKCVADYWNYKDKVQEFIKEHNLNFSKGILGIYFVIEMPKSWSDKKKARMVNTPHQQRPDLDNMIKAFKDAALKEDSHIWKYSPAPFKVWGYRNEIVIL